MNASPTKPCPNCGTPAATPYCPACGESQSPPLLSVAAWLRDTLEELVSLDGRVFSSARALLLSPGTLDRAWASGRRKRYLSPNRLYLIAAAFLFFATSLVPDQVSFFASFAAGWLEGGSTAALPEEVRAEATAKVARWVAASLRWVMLFGMVPALAAITRLLMGRSDDYFAPHLVASLHVHAVMYLGVGAVLLAVKATGHGANPDAAENWSMILVLPLVLVYAVILYRRVFAHGWKETVARLMAVCLGYMTALIVVAVVLVLAATNRG